ncbi:MAG: gamma-glutamyltransferase [Longimicrobiales bacterium]
MGRGAWGRVMATAVLAAGIPLLGSCADAGDEAGTRGGGPEAVADVDPAPAHAPVARSDGGMVVSGSVHATEAGRRMLAMGGNAVDAAVAAAFALAVAEPTQSGLGGRTQILIYRAGGGVHAVDGTTEVPASYDPDTAPSGEHGHGAVAIPGTVAALTAALETHGTLPLATVVGPALTWAREGHALTEGEAERLAGVAGELDPDSEAARIFTAGEGAPLTAGTLLVQPDLAGVLDAIAREGRAGFYGGPVAERLAADMAANGGYVTLADLAAYRATATPTGSVRYRGLEVVGSYLPASGVTVGQALAVLARFEAPHDEVTWAAWVAEALLVAFEDREAAEGMAPEAAVAWLTSDSLADRRARDVAARLGAHGLEVPFAGVDVAARPAHDAVRPLGVGAFDRRTEPAFTTHVSVADTMGNAVALTQSLGPTAGARVVTPGLGFLYASTLGGYLAGGGPGYRPWSSQAPLVVVRDGRPAMVIGGAGARRIVSSLVATVSRMVDHGLGVEEAMDAPRLHPTGGRILVPEGWPGIAGLEAAGYEVDPRDRDYFARLNVIEIGPDGTFRGVGEPRWIGSAASGPGR